MNDENLKTIHMCLRLSATQKYGTKTSTISISHDIRLQKIQMHSVKAAYAITEACIRVIDSKLKSALCKEIVTALNDSLLFLGLVSSELNHLEGITSKVDKRKEEAIGKKCTCKIRMAP